MIAQIYMDLHDLGGSTAQSKKQSNIMQLPYNEWIGGKCTWLGFGGTYLESWQGFVNSQMCYKTKAKILFIVYE